MTTLITIANMTGNLVLYRDLQPCDPNLPGLTELRTELGFAAEALPRKRDRDGARVLLEIARHAQLRRGKPPLESLLVIGDTDNDRRLATHLRALRSFPVVAFIGADCLTDPAVMTWDGDTATANRWALLDSWLEHIVRRSLINQQTALFLDIDKTLLGPRGRCDAEIDAARAEGALQVAIDILDEHVDITLFRNYYETLCHQEFHSLTLDNQDYVVYIALLLVSGCLTLDELCQGMQDGSLGSFGNLLTAVQTRLPSALTSIHTTIKTADAAGDPTPFKDFRHAEFGATVERMADGRLILCSEIVTLTQKLIAQGVLCLAASDKPAEASLPTPAQAAIGLLPLHHTMARVG